ncbi:hypothetical protein CU669_14750 [Paramagnetospirillum kuznetsovii]|uniref:DUF4412 domain-containing protein n=1 Tax=Paramagnetospirillum kuznetsovii TaxID=2053833 RepID=A0A364NWB8_9PROT|nr:hypothetical protein [Paramagnetospirillum kuznetsovii]RAU21205.1 hypothetical protein CU669_14750 [Paramagnetospirillum kuznetsovii]
MKFFKTLALTIGFGMCGMAAEAAEAALELLDAATSYTADFTVSSPRGTYRGKVWHAKGRERREVATSGGGQAVLLRRDLDAAYVMSLGAKWYVGVSMQAAGALAGGLDSWQVSRTKLREETVSGLKATRWTARADGPKGGFTGDIWTTRDGIIVKAVGVVDNPKGDDSPVEMTLSGLKVGAVDQQMLDLPHGWFGFDLRKVPADRIEQAIEGIKPLLEGRKGG